MLMKMLGVMKNTFNHKIELLILLGMLVLGVIIGANLDFFNKQSITPFTLNYFQPLQQQWKENRIFMDDLESLQFDPKLGLYTKIEPVEINNLEETGKKLLQAIDYNEKIQRTFKANQYSQFAEVLRELDLQNMQLKIAYIFNNVLLFRKQHRLKDAMEDIGKAFPLIELYEKSTKKIVYQTGFKSPDCFLALAYYQKGKIHRMMAGLDLNRLDQSELELCEENYRLALKFYPKNPAIHSSLGYLYNDMGKILEAKTEIEIANELHPDFPAYIHGVAYTYYKIEENKNNNKQNLDPNNLSESYEAFKRSILLFKDFKTSNSRVYFDFGKLLILMNKFDEALTMFNEGLLIDPNHALLLLERGLLLAQLGHHEAALKDLQSGRIITRGEALMHEKFVFAMKDLKDSNVESNLSLQFTQNNHNNSSEIKSMKSELIFSGQKSNRSELEKILQRFNLYSQKHGKTPTCYIAYAWGIKEHEKWVEQFARDLEAAGCIVLLDRWFTRKGQDILGFVEKIMAKDTDYIIVVGSKRFLEKYNKNTPYNNPHSSMTRDQKEHVLKIETRLLNHIIGFSQLHSDRVIPILIEGTPEESLPPLMRIKNISDFVQNNYVVQMEELIRDIHQMDQRVNSK